MKGAIRLVTSLATFCAAGCAFVASGSQSPKFFVLEVDPCTVSEEHAPLPRTILINDSTASAFLNSRRVIFSPTPETRGAYQFALWAEPPPKRLPSILANRMECSRIFQTVIRPTSYATANFALNTDLTDFHHDTGSPPGEAIVGIQADLYDLDKRTIVASKHFSKREKVESYDIDGAVPALSRAMSGALDEIVAWVGAELPKS